MSNWCTPERFASDVAGHEMNVIRAEGVHRHLRFAKPGTYCNSFNIITWPGTLCIHGDCGTYVFSRLNDMFEFFRADRDRQSGDINPSYWAEKVDAQDKHGAVYEFDLESTRSMVVEQFRDYWRGTDNFKGQLKGFRKLREAVLELDDEREFMEALYTFEYGDFEFTDVGEMHCRRHTGRFIWNCRAIVWAIAKWNEFEAKHKAEREAFKSYWAAASATSTGMPRPVDVIVKDLQAGGFIHAGADIKVEEVEGRGMTRVTAPYVYMPLLKRHIERERRIGHAIQYVEVH